MPFKDPEKAKEYQRQYGKTWSQTHPEERREIAKRYREAHREELSAKRAAHYQENIEEMRRADNAKYDPEKAHAYYLANKNKFSERDRQRRLANPEAQKARTKAWFEANKERKHELDALWRANNKDYINERRITLLKALKQDVWERYGGAVCACCGETSVEFLTIDHINGGGRKHRETLSGRQIYRWLKDQGYPEGYRVLCMNCNWASGVYGACPHHPSVPVTAPT